MRCLVHPTKFVLPKLAFLAGLSYLFVPVDLIPDRLPVVGHFDEIGFCLAGLLAARLIAAADWPGSLADPDRTRDWTPGLAAGLRFRLRVLHADLSNFFLLQYRHADGFLITGKNSGTHWLKYMLSCAIAEQFGVPLPRKSSGPEADVIIGHPRGPRVHAQLPLIASSHTIPSVLFAWRWLRPVVARPPIVILVRDVRAAMVSNYVKWRQQYETPFAEYVRGDPSGRRYVADIWWYIHFMNRWGDVAACRPDQVLIVRYEDIEAAPAYWVRKIAAHLDIPLSDRATAAALAVAGREAVEARLDPGKGETIIPAASARARVSFRPDDNRVADAIFARYLRHDLGYGDRRVLTLGAGHRIRTVTKHTI